MKRRAIGCARGFIPMDELVLLGRAVTLRKVRGIIDAMLFLPVVF